MAGSLRATVDIAINESVIVSFTPGSGPNKPPMVNVADINNLNNEQMIRYIQKLQATLEQYKVWGEASVMAFKRKEEASVDTPRPQI